jgi:acyl dehydratase
MQTKKQRGLHFEEFKVGDTFYSDEQMITDDDIMRFAELSGDHNKIHIDNDYARSTIFGERIAHGLLGLSIASGLAAKLGFAEDTIMALRSVQWKFKLPIKINDTINGIFVVTNKKELKGQRNGIVTFDVRVTNQKGDVVQVGKWVMIIQCKEF